MDSHQHDRAQRGRWVSGWDTRLTRRTVLSRRLRRRNRTHGAVRDRNRLPAACCKTATPIAVLFRCMAPCRRTDAPPVCQRLADECVGAAPLERGRVSRPVRQLQRGAGFFLPVCRHGIPAGQPLFRLRRGLAILTQLLPAVPVLDGLRRQSLHPHADAAVHLRPAEGIGPEDSRCRKTAGPSTIDSTISQTRG